MNAEGGTIIARSAHLSTRDADAIRESADTIDLAVDVDEKAVVVGRMCVSVRKKESGYCVYDARNRPSSHIHGLSIG